MISVIEDKCLLFFLSAMKIKLSAKKTSKLHRKRLPYFHFECTIGELISEFIKYLVLELFHGEIN